MKKTTAFLLGILLAFSLLAAAAESINDVKNALHDAVTLDEQLTILHQAAEDYADTLESGGWGLKWNVSPGTGWDETLIPENWDEYDYTLVHSIPDEMRGRPFIALKVTEQKETLLFGDFYTRLPADMRASSLEEAEYALIVEYRSVESGYKYSPPATSYTKICRAFIPNFRRNISIFISQAKIRKRERNLLCLNINIY